MVWILLLEKYKGLLDMSSIQLDGTHTPTKRGGEAVAYQGRKRSKTSNMLIITDSKGIPLACSEPIAGNHNDAFELVENVDKMLKNIRNGIFRREDWEFLMEKCDRFRPRYAELEE